MELALAATKANYAQHAKAKKARIEKRNEFRPQKPTMGDDTASTMIRLLWNQLVNAEIGRIALARAGLHWHDVSDNGDIDMKAFFQRMIRRMELTSSILRPRLQELFGR